MSKKKNTDPLSVIREKLNSGEELIKVTDYSNKKRNLVDFANAIQSIHGKLYETVNICSTIEDQLSIEMERNLEQFVSTLQLSQSEILENHIKSKVSTLAMETKNAHIENMSKFSYRAKVIFKRLFYKGDAYLSADDLLKSDHVRKSLVEGFITDGKLKSRDKVIRMTRGKVNSNLGRLFSNAVLKVQEEYPSKTFKKVIDSYSARLADSFTESITVNLPMEFVTQDGESVDEDVKLYVDLLSNKLLAVIKLESKAKRIIADVNLALQKDYGYRPITSEYAAVEKGITGDIDNMVTNIIAFTQEYGDTKKEMEL